MYTHAYTNMTPDTRDVFNFVGGGLLNRLSSVDAKTEIGSRFDNGAFLYSL